MCVWGGVTPSCKMEPVIICSFGAHQALPSLSNTTLLTSLPLFHPLPYLSSLHSLSISHLPHFTFLLTFTHHSIPSLFHTVSTGCTYDCPLPFSNTLTLWLLALPTLFFLNASIGDLRKKIPRGFKSWELRSEQDQNLWLSCLCAGCDEW